ncbi:prepilin-type N-terminal cleavage/methylation domain-containing protein [Patescibacteria group bacterium]|nr:prepilin-type N-terminal cleavage/methylation domain-containing protein [Patescibacteria group bacterium]
MLTYKHTNKRTTATTHVKMLKCLDVKMKRGFTIIELMAAIIVMTIGILGAYSVVQRVFVITNSASHRLTAAYLAQEGVENVRNLRDNNWIQGVGWINGIVPSSETNVLLGYDRRTSVGWNIFGGVEVSVEVSWNILGNNGSITVEENIYDWK